MIPPTFFVYMEIPGFFLSILLLFYYLSEIDLLLGKKALFTLLAGYERKSESSEKHSSLLLYIDLHKFCF